MSRYHSYLTSACRIIESYTDAKPFSFHLKQSFAAEKKFGSRDRKMISTLCYAYFRLGHALREMTTADRLLTGLFLSTDQPQEILEVLHPPFNQQVSLPVSEKLDLLNIGPQDVFPFLENLSGQIDATAYTLSFFLQPDVFLRVRPGKLAHVCTKLEQNNVSFVAESEDCLRISGNANALDSILQLNKEAVVQDKNSQKVLHYLEARPTLFEDTAITAWDCCAASGGKSILLYDTLKGRVRITVSDIRENILRNLASRFQQAKIPLFRSFVTDLDEKAPASPIDLFSIIICDAPCTGSGTWSRTPEQLLNFSIDVIDVYAARQKNIVKNSAASLQPAGLFFYITCSVFKKENEEITAFIQSNCSLQLVEEVYHKGYDEKADTMYVAVFTKREH